jgi:predicted negative regulator of RcsB-dependent stress response
MTDKLNRNQVKLLIGVVLLLIAGKMGWKLASTKAGAAARQRSSAPVVTRPLVRRLVG